MDENLTSVNTAPVEGADPVNAAQESGQAVETTAAPAEETTAQASEQTSETRFEKAFAARLRKEQEKFESQYSTHKFVIERAAAENNMTVEEYLNAVKQQYEDKEFENLDPSIKEDIKWARERREQDAKERAAKAEAEKWNSEVKSLLERFPDVRSASDIPDEVLEMHLKDGIPLRYAYADYALGKERTKIEQETLKKLQSNSASAVGSLSSTNTDTRMKISEMSQQDFEKLKQEVLQGKRRSL